MIEPKEYRKRAMKKRVCVLDTETDPFKHGTQIAPFCLGFYDGEIYRHWWGDDCIQQFFDCLDEDYLGEDLVIYAHNGGRFDFMFFLPHLDKDQMPMLINSRIVSCKMHGKEFRDSFAILPVALSAYQKDEIDYALFERPVREKHRKVILDYLKTDCLYLYEIVTMFLDLFGDRLTIGSTALPLLNSFHGYERMTERDDDFFRQFYFGGRVQCFETGVVTSRKGVKVYDVNSMYPRVMRDYEHPVGRDYFIRNEITPLTAFAKIEATSKGALPQKQADGSLAFPIGRGVFCATGHEIRAALELKLLTVHRVSCGIQFQKRASFAAFVDTYYAKRLEMKARVKAAKDRGDFDNEATALEIFYKLILNSSYGKFAQDPRKYKTFAVTDGPKPEDDRPLRDPTKQETEHGWELDTLGDSYTIWRCPSGTTNAGKKSARFFGSFRNVATAASITGAARADLLRGLARCSRPIYCDTDSIICESLDADIDGSKLGAWKLEMEGNRVAIVGKKTYAVFDDENPDPKKRVKKACKGARLTAQEIERVAKGEEIESPNPVPHFKRDGKQHYVSRKIRITAGKGSRGMV